MKNSLTFLKVAEEVLRDTKVPMGAQSIWEKAVQLELDKRLSSSGKTPWRTIGAQLYVDLRDNKDSVFVQCSSRPALFGLKNMKYDNNKEETETQEKKYKEKDLHKVLVKYLDSDLHFKCYTKTIRQQAICGGKSKSTNANMWVYSDLIGVYLPFDDFDEVSLKALQNLNETPYKIFSFEMKVKIDFSNFKEYYFQAVSNSSWANEGYLVCSELLDDPDLLDELRILNAAHGIGLIVLNLDNPTQSEIVLNARQNEKLDIYMLNKLIRQNNDVKEIFKYINDSYSINKKFDTNIFDKVLTDEEYQKYSLETFGA